MKEIVKQIEINKNINNINGVFSINDTKYFFKILNAREFIMEKNGYNELKKYYNVAEMIAYDIDNSLVMYKYNTTNKEGEGLLVDYYSKNDCIDEQFKNIFQKYYLVFNETIKKSSKGNCKIFFEDRLQTRLKNNLNNPLVKKYNTKILNINNKKVLLETTKLEANIYNYFENVKQEWCIISNADPNDLNICLDGSLFDYTAGGNVPLMCEFAVFACYTLIQGEYLALKYNKKAFKNHMNIMDKINCVQQIDNKIIHKPRNIRIEAFEYYAKNIVEPILSKINYKDWFHDFKNYFSMKLLAVFPFDNMEEKDILLSITYFNLIYKQKINNIDDLINFIKNLYE